MSIIRDKPIGVADVIMGSYQTLPLKISNLFSKIIKASIYKVYDFGNLRFKALPSVLNVYQPVQPDHTIKFGGNLWETEF